MIKKTLCHENFFVIIVFLYYLEDFETILQHAVEFFVLIIVAIINYKNIISIDCSLANKFQDFRLEPNQEPFRRHFCFTNNYFSDYSLIIVGLDCTKTNFSWTYICFFNL